MTSEDLQNVINRLSQELETLRLLEKLQGGEENE